MSVERAEPVNPQLLRDWKRAGRKIAMLTAYDYLTARLCEVAGVDLLLVGDTLGMVVLGHETTTPVTMEDILHHTRAVVRGVQRAHVVADLPFMSYHVSDQQAVENAGRLIKEGGAGSVKLEGGAVMARRVQAIADAGIPVMGHVGLQPQTSAAIGGFKVRGREAEEAARIVADARAVAEAGAYALVLEAVPRRVAALITERLTIPTIGIGAGPDCDGQVLVTPDMLGLREGPYARFVKQYLSLYPQVLEAMRDYADEVRSGAFPTNEHSYLMKTEEVERLRALLAEDG